MLLTYDFKDQIRELESGISLIVEDAPTLLGLVGLSGERLSQTKYEWMSDNLNSNRANLVSAALASATNITVTAGEGSKFRVNSILVAGEEYLKVTAVSGDVITVVRGFDGTPASDMSAGDEIRIVSRPQLQGAMPGQDEGHDRYTQYNYTQIVERYAAVSGTQMAVKTHNVTNELQYQVELRMKELARELNDILIYGRRIAGAGGQPGMTGGLFNFAQLENSHKENQGGGELTAKTINDAVEEVFKRGGSVNTILTNTAGARQLSKLAGPSIQTVRTDDVTGHTIRAFQSDLVGGGQAFVVVDPNMPKDKVALLDNSILGLHSLRPIVDMDASVNGADFVARQIRGEIGVKVKNAKEKIAIIENIASTVS